MAYLRRILFFLPAFFLVGALFFSCNDSSPTIVDVQFKSVFDFESYTEPPQIFAYLFVKPDTDIELAATITLRHVQSGYVWNIDSPQIITEKDSSWAGSARLVYPAAVVSGKSASFPQGAYTVHYIDSAERENEATVNLIYPLALDTAFASSAMEVLFPSSTPRFAVYDEQEQFLYFGEKKTYWTTLESIRAEYPAAFSARECFVAPGNSAVVLMPRMFGGENSNGI